jgi:hypothetical protein
MFGKIASCNAEFSDPNCATVILGSTNSLCASGSPGGTPGDPHPNQGGQILIDINVSLWAGLNCGDRHFDPKTQGQAVPEGNDFADFTSDLICSDRTGVPARCIASEDPLAERVTLDITNSFSWSNAGAVRTINQTLWQTTNLATTASETGKDQDFTIETCVSSQKTDLETCRQSGSFNFSTSQPVVIWRQNLTDPDMSGTSEGFTQDINGSFVYNGDFLGLGAVEFGCGLGMQGCSAYPNGSSQTQRSTGTGTPKETLPPSP